MTTIIVNNANELYTKIIKRYPKIGRCRMYRNQIKMMIYLYLTDTVDSLVNELFYNDPYHISILDKYARYLESHMLCFQNSINQNKVYIHVDVSSTPFISKSQKKTKRPTKVSVYRLHTEAYNSNKQFIIEFMEPYTNFRSSVSFAVYGLIEETYRHEELKRNTQKTLGEFKLSEMSKKISLIQSEVGETTSTDIPITALSNKIEKIKKLSELSFKYTNEVNKYINTNRELLNILGKDKGMKWQKEYCQRTILLNVDKMRSILNSDVLDYIKSFMDPTFLESVRKCSIQDRFFAFPKQKVSDILYSMTVDQIQMICRTNLTILYETSRFEEDEHLSQFNENIQFMNYYGMYNCHSSCDTNILEVSKKKHIIRKILSNVPLLNYYGFQRDLFILNKILKGSSRIKPPTLSLDDIPSSVFVYGKFGL